MRIIVYHDLYGCETGCCGHRVEIVDPPADVYHTSEFAFDHPNVGEDPIAFAKRRVLDTFGAEHVADLDWDDCRILDYDDDGHC